MASVSSIILGAGMVITALVYLAYLNSPSMLTPILLPEYAVYRAKFSKQYKSVDEILYRYAIFEANARKMDTHNKLGSSYIMAPNSFTDLTFDEFKSKYLNRITRSYERKYRSVEELIRDAVDWREKGVVSRVKSQGECSAGWAFAVTSAIESYLAMQNSVITEVSEQELIDCSMRYGTGGCNSGSPDQVLWYVIDHGVALESEYPYLGYDSLCKSGQATTKSEVTGYRLLDPPDISTLVKELMIQPVVVSIAVDESFMHYSSGIYTTDKCDGELSHSLLAVGFNTLIETPYFILKNSFGKDWGQEGYADFAIGVGSGLCGIANEHDVIVV